MTPSITDILRRGWKRRCPRCGVGPLFEKGIRIHKRCPECGLLYQRDYGDTWMFMIITDRIPILFGIAAVYFGYRPGNWLASAAFLFALAAPIILTIRERQGLALALDYLMRVRLQDPTDEIHGGREHAAAPAEVRAREPLARDARTVELSYLRMQQPSSLRSAETTAVSSCT
jgi:uncharacterized protein (DUF983 family)